MVTKLIDISHWQGFPDFSKVKAAGVIAMIHKATEGDDYVDPNRAKNIVNATKAGIACCTYHWLKPGNVAAQIKFYLDTIDPVPGERMVIDYEEDGCTLDHLHDAVNALLADRRKLQVTVYSGHLLKEQLGDSHDKLLADHTDLWVAQYTSASSPSWPKGTYPLWTAWQWSETGDIAGIEDSNVDLNRFNGSDENLLKWINPAGGDMPIPAPGDNEVMIDIVLPEGVTVSITVNGEVIGGPS